MTSYARITIKGDGLKYTTVLPLFDIADVIAFIDKYHRKNELKRMPAHQQKGTDHAK